MVLSRHHSADVNPDNVRDFAAAGSADVADAGGLTPVMLPSGRFASDAEYLQQGDDLLLIGPDGTMVVIRDYFLTDTPPDLLTPEGGRITPAIVDAFTPPEAAGQYAQAGSSAAEAIGQISTIVGKVVVVRADGVREEVGAGDPIFQGDVIETADGAAVDILFVDNTTFALADDARLAIDKLVYDPDTKEGSSSYSILKGMFVFSSGELAKINPLDMTIKTTIATIGIRGTTVAGEILPPGEPSKFTIIEGEIIVLTDAGYVVLSETNETTFVTGFDAPPSEAVLLSTSEIDGFYDNVKGISSDYYNSHGVKGGSKGDEDGSGEGGARGSEGSGDEPNLDQLAEALSDLAPAAGGEGEGEGGSFGNEVTLLRVDQNPFRTEAKQQLNLTENAGDELNDDSETGSSGDGGSSSGGDSASTTPAETVEDENSGQQSEGEGVAFPDGGTTLTASPGDDTITGGEGNDTFQLLGSNNGFVAVNGGPGYDRILGGEGDDSIGLSKFVGENTVEEIDGGAGRNIILGASNDSVFDFSNTTLKGIAQIKGGGSNDTIIGSSGADTILGAGGSDLLDGGGGDDAFLFFGSNIGFNRITGGTGFDRIVGSDEDDVIGLSNFTGSETVEQIDGGAGENVIIGASNDSVLDFSATALIGISRIDGGGGDDTITGSSGNDTIEGGSGNDLLDGLGGDDVFLVSGTGNGFDRFTGGAGNDLILGSADDDVIGLLSYSGDQTVEEIDGGAGENVIVGASNTTVFDFSETVLTNIARIEGSGGKDTITGSSGDDTILGGGGNDKLTGGDGDDHIDAGAGTGWLFGGAGNDRLVVENDDFLTIDGGADIDTIVVNFTLDLTGVADSRIENIERFDLRSGSDAVLTIGLDDVLAATSGINALTGGEDDLVIRRDAGDTVNVVGDSFETSQDSIDTDNDGVAEGYTVFNDAATGATVYVENAQSA